MMKLGPTPPNCGEMLKYLVDKGVYTPSNTSHDALLHDAYIEIISSACNLPVEKVIQDFQTLVKREFRQNLDK